MRKFNGYERQLIREALSHHLNALESEVTEMEGRSIFAPGFFTMTINELLEKVDTMTLKKHLK
jgi:hypothetical protein